MTAAATTDLRQLIANLPKIELHRHLEGSIRLSTLISVAKQYNIDLPAHTVEDLRPHVQITANSPHESTHFLSKFSVLRRFFYSPDVIRRIAREAVEDAADDNVRYMELRFTPKALTKLMNFSFSDVVRWVCDGVREGQQGRDIQVQLILSMNRHESVLEGERTLRAALDFRHAGVVAVDLAGQESGHPASPFFGLFGEAQQAGLGITVHAGEWAGPRNIRDAILTMGATRIGHGVRIVEDSVITQLALERDITFEVCPTSNMQSGVTLIAEHHPLRDMHHLGLRTTINTDDPSISNIQLTDEMVLAVERLGLTLDDLKQMILHAAGSAFLPPDERTGLIDYFTEALSAVQPPDEMD